MYRNWIYAALAAGSVVTAMVPASVAAQTQPAGVTVAGTGEVKAQPNVAYVTFGVQTESPDAAKAAQENATATTALISSITGSGIPKTDIETAQYSISPIVDYQKSPPVTTGYRVTNAVRVKVRDIGKIGQIIDTGVASGANNVQGVSFDIEDPSRLRREALVLAMKSAEADAKLVADTLGVRLGKVISVTESGPIIPRPVELGVMKAQAATTPIIPGQLTVSATVSVVYAIL